MNIFKMQEPQLDQNFTNKEEVSNLKRRTIYLLFRSQNLRWTAERQKFFCYLILLFIY
jgi:hypothetical protein